MKVTGDWINNSATQAVCQMLDDAGFQPLFVGGCVRNALMGYPVADIDIATDATPVTVMQLAEQADLKSVPTGLDHGTVTVVSNHIPHEITTFRKDIASFGRHAQVAFGEDIIGDARRRDFTMNALYAQADGTVIDPLGGLDDLQARRVRFIEDASQRICEDYLRILRFFRFHAWYGDPSGGIDTEALSAIATHTEGLDQLSRERVGSEILKLLAAPDPAPSIAAMRSTGVLQKVLPGSNDQALAPLIHLEQTMCTTPNPLRRLIALGGENSSDLLRLSKAQVRELDVLRTGISDTTGAAELGYRNGVETGFDILLLRAALLEHAIDSDIYADVVKGAHAQFPLSAADLMPDYTGPALGVRLRKLEQRWVASDFTLTKSELL